MIGKDIQNKDNWFLSFVGFLKGKEVRQNIIVSIIGFVIILIGSLLIKHGRLFMIVDFIGMIMVFASTDQIIKKCLKVKCFVDSRENHNLDQIQFCQIIKK